MLNNWTVSRRLIAGFGLAALTLALVVVVSYRNASRVVENDAWVEHTYQVRTDIADLLSSVKDAETGQRGYLITGDDAYLAPYQGALDAIKGAQASVARLVADNPNQLRRLAALSPLIDA